MGKPSRSKGSRGEGELAALLPGARRISAPYRRSPDGLWRNRYYEVKRRASGFKSFYKWLADEDTTMLFVRADREEWLAVMELDTLLDLFDE